MSKKAEAGSLKVGDYVVLEGEPCEVVESVKSKPGKHGAAKVRLVGIGIFDKVKRSFVGPVDSIVDVPILERRAGQVISTTPSEIQVMDLETYEMVWVPMPEEEVLKSRLSSGVEVEYLRALGKCEITRVKA